MCIVKWERSISALPSLQHLIITEIPSCVRPKISWAKGFCDIKSYVIAIAIHTTLIEPTNILIHSEKDKRIIRALDATISYRLDKRRIQASPNNDKPLPPRLNAEPKGEGDYLIIRIERTVLPSTLH